MVGRFGVLPKICILSLEIFQGDLFLLSRLEILLLQAFNVLALVAVALQLAVQLVLASIIFLRVKDTPEELVVELNLA